MFQTAFVWFCHLPVSNFTMGARRIFPRGGEIGGMGTKVPMGRDCNPGIPDPGIPDRFSIPKSRDYERPNPGISGLENNVLTLLVCVKCMH